MTSFLMVRRHDGLASQYARGMDHFDCGKGLFVPIAGANMTPPCVGYHDSKGDWNPIANITWWGKDGKLHHQSGDTEVASDGFEPLPREPVKMEQMDIEWRPRTSKGVRQWNIYVEGETPSGVPIGAQANIRYQSKTKFGAILICGKPITLTAYNDETLLRTWIEANKIRLSLLHGDQIRRYGLKLVTTTYTAPKCSINAWMDEDKDALIGAKVKAQMLGEDGINVGLADQLTDKDWTNYKEGPKKDGLVVFFDGFEFPKWEWWVDGVKLYLGMGTVVNCGKKQKAAFARQSTLRGDNILNHRLTPRESLPIQKLPWDEKTIERNNISLPQAEMRRDMRSQTDPTRLADGFRDNMISSAPKHSKDAIYEDQQPLIAKSAPNGTGNRLSYTSTASHPSTKATGSVRRSFTIGGKSNSRANGAGTTSSSDRQDHPSNASQSQSPDPGTAGSAAYHLQSTRGHDSRDSTTTAIKDFRQHSNFAERGNHDSHEHELNSYEAEASESRTQASNAPQSQPTSYPPEYEDDPDDADGIMGDYDDSQLRYPDEYDLDYQKPQMQDSKVSHPETPTPNPRNSLRHKTSSPSLRRPS